MKILYIAPFKDKGLNGFLSRSIINDLQNIESIELSLKCISLDYNNMDNNISYKEENNDLSYRDYDIVIQHCPVEMMVTNSNIKKSIFIPIVDEINQKHTDTLLHHKFDKLLVNNKTLFDLYKKTLKNTTYFRLKNLKKLTNHKYDSQFLNNTTKIYYIGNYNNNKLIIDNVIYSFLMAFRDNPNISLALFIDDPNNIAEQLNKSIIDIQKKINYVQYSQQILISNQNTSDEYFHAIHNTCNIYIDIGDSKSALNAELAQIYKNKIYYTEKYDTYSYPNTESSDIGDTIKLPDILCMSNNLKKLVQNDKHNQYIIHDFKYLGDIIKKLL